MLTIRPSIVQILSMQAGFEFQCTAVVDDDVVGLELNLLFQGRGGH